MTTWAAPDVTSPAQSRRGPGPHEARERAISLLYEAETKAVTPQSILDDLPLLPAAYALELVQGVSESVDSLDKALNRHSDSWSVSRMPAMDRAILRVALFELRAGSAPPAVVLDEAVELAKEYSTENSGRFVNGVLAAALGELSSGAAFDEEE